MASILVLAGFSTILNEKAYGGGFTNFGDFKCWLPDSISQFSDTPIGIEDQFGEFSGADWRQIEYCAAAEKNLESSPFSEFGLRQHYQGWLWPEELQALGTGQTVIINVPQFQQTFETELLDLEMILVPADKLLPPDTFVPTVDKQQHWNCYNITGPIPETENVFLTTQHGDQIDSIDDPFIFCLPMIKNDGENLFGALLEEHLICYNITVIEDLTMTNPLPIRLFDQLEPSGTDFTVGAVEKLCVPATKSFPTVGGSMIPIDSTALLLAGVQSISMWMIPVVVAGVGIGVFVIIRRK